MAKIIAVDAREILDSRATPTLETTMFLDNDISASVSIPSGASVGTHEALELRDEDKQRYLGKGVLKAVYNVEKVIGPKIIGLDPTDQKKLDQVMIDLDGTKNKSHLGANSILSCSIAAVRAAAFHRQRHLFEYINEMAGNFGLKKASNKIPIPLLNLINGGKHGAGNLEFQEFHIIPLGIKTFINQIRAAAEIYKNVEIVLKENKAIHSIGDEGGFAPNLFTNLDALEVVSRAINQAGYILHKDIYLGLDVAADFFYQKSQYTIRDRTSPMSTQDFISFYRQLREQYPLLILEDPLFEDDWKGWTRLAQVLDLNQVILVGDDLLCTNKERTQKAIQEKCCNAILIKPNQVGTISETLSVIKLAQEAGWKIIISHRSGETCDDFIADFAVGVGADFVKFGAPARGERTAKYNRLAKIEEIVGIDHNNY
ncbi:MAG: phosphopyruvate hydratase [Candidatus Shapirobacteria bacterium]|nr:phosphopyruvate hydratase [Candidatus Shapirobacteria bacterium]